MKSRCEITVFILVFWYQQFAHDKEDSKLNEKRQHSPRKCSAAEASPSLVSATNSSTAPKNPLSVVLDEDPKPEEVSRRSSECGSSSSNVQSPVAKSMNAVADRIASVLETEESMRVYYGKISTSLALIIINYRSEFLQEMRGKSDCMLDQEGRR